MDESINSLIEELDGYDLFIDDELSRIDHVRFKQDRPSSLQFDATYGKNLHHAKQLYPVTVIKGDV